LNAAGFGTMSGRPVVSSWDSAQYHIDGVMTTPVAGATLRPTATFEADCSSGTHSSGSVGVASV
jgi:hypothetical protein